MTRAEIIQRARDQLAEETTGQWEDIELYRYGWEGVKDFILKEIDVLYLGSLCANQQLTFESALPQAEFDEGKLFNLSDLTYAIFNKPIDVVDVATQKSAIWVDKRKTRIYEENSLMKPSTSQAIAFPYQYNGVVGIAVVPCGDTAEIYYAKLPDEWEEANKDEAPETLEATHTALVDYICIRALEKDNKGLLLKYENNYKRGILQLGGKV